MKKLLLLGGSRYLLPVIKAAKDLGIYTITCDYLPDNIAHKYSDEYCNVSIIDKEAVLAKAMELKVDGVLSFACDPGVVTMAYVTEKMSLPSVGSYESVCILQNKGLFRDFLSKNGFSVPKAKSYQSVDYALNDAEVFKWPVIVKPVDSAGSKGVTKVEKPEQLEQSIKYALQFSHCNEFIIEEYITQKGFSSDTDSFSINGELKFVSFSSQRFDKKAENPYTPAAYSWPATISDKNQKLLTSEIQRLIKLLGMKTSIYNIETREDEEGNAYIMECSPRGGGNRLAEMLRYATGVDLISNTVKAAVGMTLDNISQEPYNGCWAEIILHSDKSGVFDELWISEEIRENIVEKDLWITQGTEVGGFSGANEAIGTLVLKFDTQSDLNYVLDDQERYVRVVLKEDNKNE